MTKKIIWGRSYRGYHREFFLRFSIGSNWALFQNTVCVDDLWKIYNDNVINALFIICPVTKMISPDEKPKHYIMIQYYIMI